MIRILIVDDHPVVRDGLVAILSTQPDFEVIGEIGDGGAALDWLRSAQQLPDILLLDLEIPTLDGVEVLQQLSSVASNVPVLIFTAYDTDERILEAVKAGAKGYLLKGSPRNELFGAIRTVASGGSLLQPVVASKLMRQLREQPPAVPTLTAREQEVLELLSQGLQNKEIAQRLTISERTAKFHVSALLSKLGASNRTEAVTIAIQQGLISVY